MAKRDLVDVYNGRAWCDLCGWATPVTLPLVFEYDEYSRSVDVLLDHQEACAVVPRRRGCVTGWEVKQFVTDGPMPTMYLPLGGGIFLHPTPNKWLRRVKRWLRLAGHLREVGFGDFVVTRWWERGKRPRIGGTNAEA